MRKTILILLLTAVTVLPLAADGGDYFLALTGNYNMPYNNEVMDSNIGLGAAFRFWGIFNFTASVYTEVVSGGDNIFNIERFDPLGLFSLGVGMRIPMGDDFGIVMDWQKYYRGIGSDEGVYSFSDSWKIGISIDLSDVFGMEVYKRKFYGFSDKAKDDPDTILNGAPPDDGIDVIGIGLLIYL